jgi:AcrR family transcriptional regulator
MPLVFDTVKRDGRIAAVTSATAPDGAREALLAAARAELLEHGRAGISLRAVARRAGVSHALPKYHFQDRAGMLTAIATEGFAALDTTLSQITEQDPQRRLAALGAAYIDFGLANPALFDLMFQRDQLHPANPELIAAQKNAIGVLIAAVSRVTSLDVSSSGAPLLALVSWALVHGLVVLARDGALQSVAGTADGNGADLAHQLARRFTDYVGEDL